jgi:uncharacterized protein
VRRAVYRAHHIRRLSVFGSTARGENTPDSDIDLLVQFEEDHAPSLAGFARLQNAFKDVSGIRESRPSTPSILNNRYRRKAILSGLKELYAI